MAARLVGRPVKLVLRREQMFGPVGHRAPTRQTLRLGADDSGALTAIALGRAIDEMAEACGMEPLEFRLKNYAKVEPITGKPFSSKALRECYAQGAARWRRSKAAARACPTRRLNANFGEYHVPVSANIPAIDAILVAKHDPHVNALGIKGVCEIAITGSAGAAASSASYVPLGWSSPFGPPVAPRARVGNSCCLAEAPP